MAESPLVEPSSDARDGDRAQRIGAWSQRLPTFAFITILIVGLFLILTFSIPAGAAPLRVGDVAKQNDHAPQRISYVSQIKTRQLKDAAAAAVADVYDYDPGVAQQQRAQAQMLFNGVSSIRTDSTITAEQKRDRIQRLAEGMVAPATSKAIQSMDDFAWPAVITESTRVLDEIIRDRVRQSDLPAIKTKLSSRFSQALTPEQLSVAVAIVSDLVKPNEIYNASETVKQRREAQDKIEPVREVVEKGEVVVREGNVVGALDLEKLEALGIQQSRTDWFDIAGTLLLSIIIALVLYVYLTHFQPDLLKGDRRTLLIVVGMLLATLAARLAGSVHVLEGVTWVYLMPIAAVPILVSMFVNERLGVLIAFLCGILAGYTAGPAFDAAAMFALGGAVGALRARRIDRLSGFLWMGMAVALANVIVVLAFILPSSLRDVSTVTAVTLMALIGGSLAAAITAIVFAPLGNALSAHTVLHLLELAHPSQPLFRRLLLEAPGTYHHSVVISSLAEGAAEAIGADSLLVRVGAYYHDIGKVVRPYLYIENQVNGNNIHDTLDAQTSATAIISHVSDGMELARRFRLPQRVQDMIPQHHGTKLVGYFYAQARARNEQVNEADFRYPGPKPQTREAGILMLADGVEATVRATRDHSPEVIDRVIRESIGNQIADGQMNECDLTLRDLDKIREAFGSVLQGVYHPRIAYPPLPGPSPVAGPLSTEAAPDTHDHEAAAAAPSRPRRRQRASAHDRERP